MGNNSECPGAGDQKAHLKRLNPTVERDVIKLKVHI